MYIGLCSTQPAHAYTVPLSPLFTFGANPKEEEEEILAFSFSRKSDSYKLTPSVFTFSKEVIMIKFLSLKYEQNIVPQCAQL